MVIRSGVDGNERRLTRRLRVREVAVLMTDFGSPMVEKSNRPPRSLPSQPFSDISLRFYCRPCGIHCLLSTVNPHLVSCSQLHLHLRCPAEIVPSVVERHIHFRNRRLPPSRPSRSLVPAMTPRSPVLSFPVRHRSLLRILTLLFLTTTALHISTM